MTDAPSGRPAGADDETPTGPVVRDRRRIDPETGQVREPVSEEPVADSSATAPADETVTEQAVGAQPMDAAAPAGESEAGADGEVPVGDVSVGDVLDAEDLDTDSLAGEAASLAAERLADLQRLQAEYVNYRRRVDRDRDVARDGAVSGVLEALLPVLDDVHLAREHGDLVGGPFAAIAEKLDTVLERFGLSRYGQVGEPFDPAVHEALMHAHSEDVEVTTVVQVMQPGYRVGEKVLRAARVAVADPQ